MSFTCPRGTILYGTHCIGCDCERAPAGRPVSRTLHNPVVPRPIGRQFVIHDGPPIRDVPLRVPRHYCLDCGQRVVPCFECGYKLIGPDLVGTYPMDGTQEGHHIAHCPTHGPLAVICPARGLNDFTPRWLDAGRAGQGIITQHQARLANAPGQSNTVQDGPLDDVRDNALRVRAAITVGVLIGFLIGLAVGLAAPIYLHFIR